MKTKVCASCDKEYSVMYRVQITAGKKWVFCCESCTKHHQSFPNYKYGGTWKGKRH
ncbi:MAG: hypothetical protein ABF274_06765 [Nonlabens sp.]|uniref:hypothetical protein n=1 Tax=Nonlabens sp. TaxID=1888209 RepID=UPI003219C5ED